MHILVADDDGRTLALFEAQLRQWGHSVTTACDGMTAMEALQRDHSIRMAVLNWMMPGLGGLAISRQLKASRAGVCTLVMVGGLFCEEVRHAFPSWADGYLGKPFDMEALGAHLRAARVAWPPLAQTSSSGQRMPGQRS